MRILVTGGAGFIGSAMVRYLIQETSHEVLTVDKLTYAGSLTSLNSVKQHSRFSFKQLDICNQDSMKRLFAEFAPDAIFHLAAETHVDRSIDGPGEFIQSNIVGTYSLLEAARNYWSSLSLKAQASFRFVHISTDEVFGSLGLSGKFTEATAYSPRSPYAASKASADHLVRAWFHTFKMPTIITNCSNNYGPYQFPEKLIPLMCIKTMQGSPLPIYGNGSNIRDWLYVDDHVRALLCVMERGVPGSTYNIGGECEKTNLEVVQQICSHFDTLLPQSAFYPHSSLISYVTDRPGHDFRYSIDTHKISTELGWRPLETFETGLLKTIKWYLAHASWWEPILHDRYQGERLGQIEKPSVLNPN